MGQYNLRMIHFPCLPVKAEAISDILKNAKTREPKWQVAMTPLPPPRDYCEVWGEYCEVWVSQYTSLGECCKIGPSFP